MSYFYITNHSLRYFNMLKVNWVIFILLIIAWDILKWFLHNVLLMLTIDRYNMVINILLHNALLPTVNNRYGNVDGINPMRHCYINDNVPTVGRGAFLYITIYKT